MAEPAELDVLTGPWFRTLAETTATALFVFRDRFLFANPATTELTGYTTEELLEKPFWVLAHPDSVEMVRSRGEARLRGENPPSRYQARIVRKDGDVRWVEATAGRIELADGPAIVGTAIDITERKQAELSLQESRDLLDLAQRAGRSVLWEWHLERDALVCSRAADELTGLDFANRFRTGAEFAELVHPEDRQRLQSAIGRIFKGEPQLDIELRAILPDGTVHWLSERAIPVRNESGRVERLVGIAHDITERKLAEDALFQETERAQVTLAAIGDGIIRTDARGQVDYLNPVAEGITGWKLTQAYGRPVGEIFRVVDEGTLKPVLDPVGQCLEERRTVSPPGSRLLLSRTGTNVPVQDSAAPIHSRRGELLGAILVFKDLSRLRQMEREVNQLSSQDYLTGLINRRVLRGRLADCLEQAQREGRQHGLLYLDVHDMRLINETCGLAAGDEAIKMVASELLRCLGEGATVARLIGDEFGVLLRDHRPEEVREVAARLRNTLREQRFEWGDRFFPLASGIGVVFIDRDSPDTGPLLRAAEAACHVAKTAGRNRIHEYQPDDRALAEMQGEMQWISRIHRALAEDRFCLYRQRIEPLGESEGSPLSEIFVRLVEDDGSLVTPSLFILAAERYQLASDIDRWVVGKALRCLAEGGDCPNRKGSRFTINLSGQSLGESTFLDFVAQQFEATGVDPRRILFEITETAAIADIPHALRFIQVLRGIGCRFVLDDFGKGLSSFAYLRNLSVDFLKIDGEFVRSMVEDPTQAALVESINQIGHVMGIKTIAESVETQDVYEALRQLGVDYAQGIWVERPRPMTGE